MECSKTIDGITSILPVDTTVAHKKERIYSIRIVGWPQKQAGPRWMALVEDKVEYKLQKNVKANEQTKIP